MTCGKWLSMVERRLSKLKEREYAVWKYPVVIEARYPLSSANTDQDSKLLIPDLLWSVLGPSA
jgi:hypothetical protein